MDLAKIGSFLQQLRKEKGLTQEQIAEQTGVARRTVSRWETGSNMPDLDVLIELSDFYEIDLREILSGERKKEAADQGLKETVQQVADYSNEEKTRLLRRMRGRSLGLLILCVLAAVICLWRFWPHSFKDIVPQAEPASLTAVRASALIYSTDDNGLHTDSYAAVFSAGDEGWSEIMWLLASSAYRKDLRDPFLPLFNGFSSDAGDKILSLDLNWSSDTAYWNCSIMFPSNHQMIVSFADRSYSCIYHPADQTLLDQLTAYMQENGENVK